MKTKREKHMSYLDQYLDARDKLSALRWDLFYIKSAIELAKGYPSPEITLAIVQQRIEQVLGQLDGNPESEK